MRRMAVSESVGSVERGMRPIYDGLRISSTKIFVDERSRVGRVALRLEELREAAGEYLGAAVDHPGRDLRNSFGSTTQPSSGSATVALRRYRRFQSNSRALSASQGQMPAPLSRA